MISRWNRESAPPYRALLTKLTNEKFHASLIENNGFNNLKLSCSSRLWNGGRSDPNDHRRLAARNGSVASENVCEWLDVATGSVNYLGESRGRHRSGRYIDPIKALAPRAAPGSPSDTPDTPLTPESSRGTANRKLDTTSVLR